MLAAVAGKIKTVKNFQEAIAYVDGLMEEHLGIKPRWETPRENERNYLYPVKDGNGIFFELTHYQSLNEVRERSSFQMAIELRNVPTIDPSKSRLLILNLNSWERNYNKRARLYFGSNGYKNADRDNPQGVATAIKNLAPVLSEIRNFFDIETKLQRALDQHKLEGFSINGYQSKQRENNSGLHPEIALFVHGIDEEDDNHFTAEVAQKINIQSYLSGEKQMDDKEAVRLVSLSLLAQGKGVSQLPLAGMLAQVGWMMNREDISLEKGISIIPTRPLNEELIGKVTEARIVPVMSRLDSRFMIVGWDFSEGIIDQPVSLKAISKAVKPFHSATMLPVPEFTRAVIEASQSRQLIGAGFSS
jgi:hypothetical protein